MSQTFCGQCGAPVEGAYCGSCGTPAPAPAPAAAPEPAPPTLIAPAAPAPRPPAPPTYGAPTPPPAYAAPPATRPAAPPAARPAGNPFAGVTVRDVVLDVLALVLLLTSLALPWDISSSSGGWNDVNDRWWAILSLVIAIFGLAVPYLGAARAIPGLTRQLTLLIKLAFVAPAAVSIFCLVLFECIHVTDDNKGGIGAGAVMLLLAALLVLVPRTYDDLPGVHRGARAAESVLYALAGATATLTVVVNVVRVFTSHDVSTSVHEWVKVMLALAMVAFVVPVVVVCVGSVRSGSRWAPVAGAVLAAYLFTSFFNQGEAYTDIPTFSALGGEKLSLSGFDSYLLVGAFGVGSIGAAGLLLGGAVALLAGRWQAAQQPLQQRAAWWVGVASLTGFFAAGVGALLLVNNTVVYAISKANHGHSHVNGTWIACMVLLAVTTVVAGLTGLFAQRYAQQKVLPVALAGAWFFLGFVLAIVTSTADRLSLGASMLTPMTVPEVFAVLFAPLLVIGALTVPTAVRRTYGAVVSLAQINAAGNQPAAPAYPAPAYPAPPAPGQQ